MLFLLLLLAKEKGKHHTIHNTKETMRKREKERERERERRENVLSIFLT
jgi:hypothetical protein